MGSEYSVDRFRVMLSCPDRRGIVAEVSALLADQGANVTAAAQFSDPASHHFFVRYEVETEAGQVTKEALHDGLGKGLADLLVHPEAELVVRRADHRPRVALLASKASHCLLTKIWVATSTAARA